LETLRTLRAALESVKQLVENVHADVDTMKGNYDAVTGVEERLGGVFRVASGDAEEEEEGKVKKGRFGRRG